MARISLLPESGAWLPKANGAIAEVPSTSCSRPSLTWPKPCPPSSGSRCAAHRLCRLTSSWSGAYARSSCSWESSSASVSSGQISRRTNSRAHSSLASYSGSVEKSHAIHANLRHAAGLHRPLELLDAQRAGRKLGRAPALRAQPVDDDHELAAPGLGRDVAHVGGDRPHHELEQRQVGRREVGAQRAVLLRPD